MELSAPNTVLEWIGLFGIFWFVWLLIAPRDSDGNRNGGDA